MGISTTKNVYVTTVYLPPLLPQKNVQVFMKIKNGWTMTSQKVANTPIFCPDMSAFITLSSEYNKDINLFSNKICTFYLNYFVRPPGTISILVSQNVKPPQHASSPTEIIFPN